jgi:hypothetical protein
VKQFIGSYEIETLTREEAQEDLKAAMGHHFSNVEREHLRGVKPIKLPIVTANATGAATAIPIVNGPEPIICGPQQGYFWRIGRITISSNGVDTGLVSLYAGSDPQSFAQQFLIDNTLLIGKAYYPGSRGLYLWPGEQLYASAVTVAGNTYRIAGMAIEVPAEMAGKLLV